MEQGSVCNLITAYKCDYIYNNLEYRNRESNQSLLKRESVNRTKIHCKEQLKRAMFII